MFLAIKKFLDGTLGCSGIRTSVSIPDIKISFKTLLALKLLSPRSSDFQNMKGATGRATDCYKST